MSWARQGQKRRATTIEHQHMKIAQQMFSFSKLLKPILDIYRMQCNMKEVRFQVVDGTADMPEILGDEKRLTQILVNLLSNAVKFTSRGGSVTLKTEVKYRESERVYLQISVADTGIGMTEEFQQRLFKPFEQESVDTFQKFGGSGLGLSIAYNLVKLMNGEISVESVLGKGSCFCVGMPFTCSVAGLPKEEKKGSSLACVGKN